MDGRVTHTGERTLHSNGWTHVHARIHTPSLAIVTFNCQYLLILASPVLSRHPLLIYIMDQCYLAISDHIIISLRVGKSISIRFVGSTCMC